MPDAVVQPLDVGILHRSLQFPASITNFVPISEIVADRHRQRTELSSPQFKATRCSCDLVEHDLLPNMAMRSAFAEVIALHARSLGAMPPTLHSRFARAPWNDVGTC